MNKKEPNLNSSSERRNNTLQSVDFILKRNFQLMVIITRHLFFSICVFVMVFLLMDMKILAAETLVYMSGGLTLLGYIINCTLHWTGTIERDRNSKNLLVDKTKKSDIS